MTLTMLACSGLGTIALVGSTAARLGADLLLLTVLAACVANPHLLSRARLDSVEQRR